MTTKRSKRDKRQERGRVAKPAPMPDRLIMDANFHPPEVTLAHGPVRMRISRISSHTDYRRALAAAQAKREEDEWFDYCMAQLMEAANDNEPIDGGKN